MTKTEFSHLLQTLEKEGRAITDRDKGNCIEVVQQGDRYTLYSRFKGYRDCFTADISLKELREIYVG